MSNASTESRRVAWYGPRQRQLVALVTQSCSARPLPHGQIYTASRISGMVLMSQTACQLGHCLPSPRIIRGQTWAVLRGSQILLPTVSEMKCCHVGNGISAPSEQPWTTSFAAVGAQVFVCQSNSHSLYTGRLQQPWGGSSPPWSLTDIVRIRVFFHARAQRAHDTPPLLPSLPLTYHGQAQKGLEFFLCYQLRPKVQDVGLFLISSLATGGSLLMCLLLFCEAFYNLSAFPALWSLSTLCYLGSRRDTRPICPINRHRSPPQKVEGHDNPIFLISEVSHTLCATTLASPRQKKPKKDWHFAALRRKTTYSDYWKRRCNILSYEDRLRKLFGG